MMRELTKSDLLAEIEEEIEIGLNALTHLAITNLEENSVVWTGFYKSSWKASPTLINHDDDVYLHSPWAGIKAESDLGGGKWVRPKNPKIERRHAIPRFRFNQTVYIANTVEYTAIAFAKSPGVVNYASSGVKKDIDRVFSDQGILTWRANIPKQ